MESQLNPNAAVFIPSPPAENSNHIEQPFNENLTQEEFFNKEDVMSSSFIAHDPVPAIISMPVEDLNGKDEVWLSSSPKKGGVPLDNVNVPPEDEFDREVSQRPGDLDVESPLNETNGSDTVFESVKNNKNILEDVCNFENAIQNGIEESVTNAESLNPFNLSKPQDVCAVQELQVSENGNKDALDLCPTEQVESNVNAELTEVEDEMRYEIGAINPLEPSSPLEPANFLQHDLLEPVNSDIFVSDAVPDQLQPQDNCNLLDAEKISSIDVQLLEPGKTDGPPEDLDEVKGNTLEPLTTVTENTSPVEEVPISDLMEQKAFTITVENPEKKFTEISAVVEDNFEHSSEQLETSKPNDSDLLNEVDVSNGNLQVCKPSENADSQSPIVAGASDFTREHFSDNTFTAPSFSQNISNIEKATGALDDAVLYSNSGFESMMDAPPATSPASHISAQSTPFDGPAFEFEHVEKALTEQEPVLDSMRQDKLDIFYQESGDTKLQFHSQNETSDFNKGFAEDSQFGAVDSVTEPESSPAKEIVDLTTEELSQIPDQISSKPDVLPEENVLDISESVDPSADHDANIETVESPESLQSGHVDLAYNANVPDVCEFPKEETVHLAENGSVTQDLVNGIEESVGTAPLPVSETVVEPAVLVESNVVPEIPTVDLDDSKVAVAEIPVVDLDVSEVAIAEPGLENNPESDSCNKLAAVAAVGAAAGAAAITVAAGVAAVSKTDKKTTSKAPTKAKPLPAAKAPIKTTTSKPSTTISATAPKKPAASPVPAARAAPKTATAAAKPAATAPKPTAAAPRTTVTAPRTTATSKPKPSEVANKTAATTKPAQPKPRVTPATRPLAEKKPLTNGDASKPAAAKPLTRPPTRPATAPARTTSKPLSSTTTAPTSKASVPTAAPRPVPARKVPTTLAAPKPKSAPTVSEAKPKTTTAAGIAARPRPATASSTTKSTLLSTKVPPSKPIDKQTKESTNKLISATRTTVSRTTASKTTASKTSASTNGTTAKATSVSSKPQPIRKPTTATTTGSAKGAVEKKSSENPTAPITNGVMKNGHATPDEKPVQNGVHDEPVIDKRESDLKIESLVDNQLVA